MSTRPFGSNVAVAANRTLSIVGLGGGGPAGAGGGWVAHAVRIVAVTAEARLIAMALRSFIGFAHLSPHSVVALFSPFSALRCRAHYRREVRAGSRVGAGRRDAAAESGDFAPPFLAENEHQHL